MAQNPLKYATTKTEASRFFDLSKKIVAKIRNFNKKNFKVFTAAQFY